MLKFYKPGFNSTWTMNFQMFKLDLPRQRNQRSSCQHLLDHRKSKFQKSFGKKIYFCFIDYAKAFDSVDENKLWKMGISFLFSFAFSSHLTSAICKPPSGNHSAFLHFFSWRWYWFCPCKILQTSVHTYSGTLSISSNSLKLFVTSTV